MANIGGYACNPADLTSETEVKGIKRKLVRQLESTVRELELHSDRTIAKIYIGKTYIQRRRLRVGYQTFDPLNHHTWTNNGIMQVHRHEEYGRDGLVVLGAITRETVPERCRDRVHQEDFALAMEQKLLHHYLLSHPDPRVVNESFSTGQAPGHRHYAYAIYMAFRYADNDTATDDWKEESPQEDNVIELMICSQSQGKQTPFLFFRTQMYLLISLAHFFSKCMYGD